MKKQGADSNGNCPNRSRKRGKWNDRAEEDRISALPCEILALILSCLTLKEADSTSIVSRRWKDLWKSFMGVLDFDGEDALAMLYMSSQTERFAVARTKYVNWVYQVLDSLRCSTVEGFRICFHVDCVKTLEEWIRFAIQKKVKIFELNLTSGCRHRHPKDITNFMLPFFNSLLIFRDILELGNVIHLELFASCLRVAAVACETFFKACTGLQRFTFKTSFDQSAHCWKFDNFHPLRSLQVVELVGFCGLPAEVVLLTYFLQSSEQLEKIIIDPYCLELTGSLKKKWGKKIPRYRSARDRALELKSAFPLWEFVVL